jgi:two-component system, chemotaxis family, sensor kinase CheA
LPKSERSSASETDAVAAGDDTGLDAKELDIVLRVFMAEAEEGFGIMESGLLRMEQHPDDRDSVAQVFRAAHSLKGNAAAFGLTALGALAHAVEDMLGDLRETRISATPDRITLLLASVDALRQLLAGGTQAPQQLVGPHAEIQRRLIAAREADGSGGAATPEGPALPAQPPTAAAPSLARTLRVSTERLDQLLSLAGEIAISRARLYQMIGTPQVPRRSLLEAHREAERLYLDLQDLVMKLRMVPVGPTFQQLARTVRDVARSLRKEARLDIVGGDVEVDNAVLQLLRDPLTHMVRNAIDHGVEMPEERIRRGKPRAGRIAVRSTRQTGAIIIELADDGAGINRERVLARARERGLATEDAGMSDAQVFALLFEAGFSTADGISDVSGRGVGLDVVRRNIHSLRGTVGITSQPGFGTTVTIRLPLTLAIIEGLLVRVAETTYVLPIEEVTESLAMPDETPTRDALHGVVSLRGRPLPYVRLRQAFRARGDAPRREVLVVISSAAGQIGVVADSVSGQGQIVIKPLAKLFQGVRGISASTVLGDGQVALILDVEELTKARMSLPVESGTVAADA